jgi:hypothetical protein
MYRKFMLVVAIFLSLQSYSDAADKNCTKEDAIKAENDTDTLTNWERVYRSFKRYGHCDDGAISEGYSDKICRMLAHDWQHVGTLKSMVQKDKRFAVFVMRHIDDTVKIKDVKKIFANSTESCPSGNEALCKSLIERICFLEKEINGFKKETKWSILTQKQTSQFCK